MHDKAQLSNTERSDEPSFALCVFPARPFRQTDVYSSPKRCQDASGALLGSFQENSKIRHFRSFGVIQKYVPPA